MKSSTVKRLLFLLIIIVIILLIALFISNKQKQGNNSLGETNVIHSEGEAKEFYSKKLIKYVDVFKDNFLAKYSVSVFDKNGKETKENEEYSIRDGKTSINKTSIFEKYIVDNNTLYYINEKTKSVIKYNSTEKLNQNNINKVLLNSLDTINSAFSSFGNEEIDGKKYYYEEYDVVEKSKTKYYFDGEDLKKIYIIYDDGTKTIFDFERIENKTFDYSFNIPEDFEVVTI